MSVQMTPVERAGLSEIASELSRLNQNAAALGHEYLALIINEAHEEAIDRLRDNVPAQIEPRPSRTPSTP